MFASTAIIVPLVIHLWNTRRGKVLQVGSIVFLEESPRKKSSSLKLTEWLLLLLRCLLILILSLLLCRPVWRQSTSAGKGGWLLMQRGNVKAGYKHFQKTVDSLLNAGFEFHYLDENFEVAAIKDALAEEDTTIKKQVVPVWPLLETIGNNIAAGKSLYVITDKNLNKIQGIRPSVNLHIQWLTYQADDSLVHEMEDAFLTTDNHIKVTSFYSEPLVSYYVAKELDNVAGKHDEVTVDNRKGLSIVNDANRKMAVDTGFLKATIYSDRSTNDGKYITAVFQTLSGYSKRKIQLSVVHTRNEIKPHQDWLFWLSNDTLPVQFDCPNLFIYATGTEQRTDSWIYTGDEGADNATLLSLWKRIKHEPINNAAEEVLWQDGFGVPLLVKKHNDKRTIYTFFSHFDPSWNGLVWSDAFAGLMSRLFFNDTYNFPASIDKRIIDSGQLQVKTAKQTGFNKKAGYIVQKDVSAVCWFLAVIVFFIERWLSFKTRKTGVE